MRSDRANSVVAATPRRGRGLTLAEMLIVIVALGVLTAIVLPSFSDASHIERENQLKDHLRYLRTQIAMFRAQHGGVAPGYPEGNAEATPTADEFIRQMTNASDARCNVGEPSAGFRFGPYLKHIPENPLNGKATILVVPNNQPMPLGTPDDSTGWIYKPQTAELIPNSSGADADGTRYTQY